MLTVPEAARRIRRHPETVRRWIRQGHLRSERGGPHHPAHEADLAALAGGAPTDLPEWMRLRPDGRPQPQWARIVRDGRREH